MHPGGHLGANRATRANTSQGKWEHQSAETCASWPHPSLTPLASSELGFHFCHLWWKVPPCTPGQLEGDKAGWISCEPGAGVTGR